MQIKVDKQLILEGIHRYHPNVDKRNNNKENRNFLAHKIKEQRKIRDDSSRDLDKNQYKPGGKSFDISNIVEKNRNMADNVARLYSEFGDHKLNQNGSVARSSKFLEEKPRNIPLKSPQLK